MKYNKKIVEIVTNWKFLFCIYAISVIVMNLFMKMDFGDDSVSKQITQGFTMLEWVFYRYNNWSSRFVQEGLGFFMIWHPLLWRIINTAILIFIPLILAYICDCKDSEKGICIIAFLMYPIIDMKSAGWICTTNTYLWPAFFGLLSVAFLKKYITNPKSFKWYLVITFYISLIIASNHELLAMLLLGVLIYYVGVYIFQNHRMPYVLMGAMVVAIINIIVILISPGNHMREELETANWFVEYADFSFVDKVYLGITRVFRILVMDMNALYIAICCLIAIVGMKFFDSVIKKIIAVLPIMMIFVLKTMCTFYVLGDVMAIDYRSISTYIPILFSVLMLICLTISLIEICKTSRTSGDGLLPIVMLYGGLATTVAMGFSPTIYASGRRTSTFMFVVLVYLLIEISKNLIDRTWFIRNNQRLYQCLIWLIFAGLYSTNLVVLAVN
ncbi:MAG: hypothetical protein J6K43_03770 [Lachnospiraceae bacterium]|nr:hypothetical protein [Lachnospiraceae bacterium]